MQPKICMHSTSGEEERAEPNLVPIVPDGNAYGLHGLKYNNEWKSIGVEERVASGIFLER